MWSVRSGQIPAGPPGLSCPLLLPQALEARGTLASPGAQGSKPGTPVSASAFRALLSVSPEHPGGQEAREVEGQGPGGLWSWTLGFLWTPCTLALWNHGQAPNTEHWSFSLLQAFNMPFLVCSLL